MPKQLTITRRANIRLIDSLCDSYAALQQSKIVNILLARTSNNTVWQYEASGGNWRGPLNDFKWITWSSYKQLSVH